MICPPHSVKNGIDAFVGQRLGHEVAAGDHRSALVFLGQGIVLRYLLFVHGLSSPVGLSGCSSVEVIDILLDVVGEMHGMLPHQLFGHAWHLALRRARMMRM